MTVVSLMSATHVNNSELQNLILFIYLLINHFMRMSVPQASIIIFLLIRHLRNAADSNK